MSTTPLLIKFKVKDSDHAFNLMKRLQDDFHDESYVFIQPMHTKNKLESGMFLNEDIFSKIANILGSYALIARICNVSGARVSQWTNSGQIPIMHIKKIIDAANKKIGRKEFKYKDLFGDWFTDDD